MKRAALIFFSFLLISIGGGTALANFHTPQTPVQKIKLVPKENKQDHVDISFKISADGKVEIVYIEATNPKLVDYVINKLTAIQLDPTEGEEDRIYRYKFRFKSQA